ncbi:MAG: KpsF/GutQ family sugar-phosphate isomerase [bacterium]|nr:KpsF/GutQ family sugar-phosphate isomerase [bacterium]
MNIIKEIQSVLNSEISVLQDIEKVIDISYEKFIKMIEKSTGKLIVLGVGKSGIIGQKIVATMISTGTPAFFLHPTEAIHGDLGIVAKNDIVLVISKSGSSREVLDPLTVVKKIGAKIVALTANADSKLAEVANLLLYMPIEKEACPLNLAPTSSTTAALVIGDALAVTLMKLRGFESKHFALFHPGGELGRKLLLKVEDVMKKGRENPVININDSIENMFAFLSAKMAGALSVIDDENNLKGLITDFDIRHVFIEKKDIYKLNIADIMNKNPNYVFDTDNAYDALEFMEKRKKPISILPVLNKERKVIGMLHLHDILG